MKRILPIFLILIALALIATPIALAKNSKAAASTPYRYTFYGTDYDKTPPNSGGYGPWLYKKLNCTTNVTSYCPTGNAHLGTSVTKTYVDIKLQFDSGDVYDGMAAPKNKVRLTTFGKATVSCDNKKKIVLDLRSSTTVVLNQDKNYVISLFGRKGGTFEQLQTVQYPAETAVRKKVETRCEGSGKIKAVTIRNIIIKLDNKTWAKPSLSTINLKAYK